jgi:hypothetical protein
MPPSNERLLVRIDERTKTIQESSKKIEKNIEDLYIKANKTNETLVTLGIIQEQNCKEIDEIQQEHKKPFHYGFILGILRYLIGK